MSKKSKAVIVIDMPNDCLECPVFKNHLHLKCVAKNRFLNSVDLTKRPTCCPLKKLPDKQTTENQCDDYYNGYYDGWNDFLFEITGEW